jgi:hypothetical protein
VGASLSFVDGACRRLLGAPEGHVAGEFALVAAGELANKRRLFDVARIRFAACVSEFGDPLAESNKDLR